MNFQEINKSFDTIFTPVNENTFLKTQSKTPCYSLEKMGEGAYLVSFPIPGVTEEDVNICATKDGLRIHVQPRVFDKDYVHQGFKPKGWHYTFKLKGMLVPHLSYVKNGMLYIELFRSDEPLKSQWNARPYAPDKQLSTIPIKTPANTP